MEKTLNTDEPGKDKVPHLQCPRLTAINILGCVRSEMCFPCIFLVWRLGLLPGAGFWFCFLFFSHIFHSLLWFPLPPLVSPPPPPLDPPLFTSPQKRAGLSRTPIKYGLTSYNNKTRPVFPHQGWTRQPSRRNRVPKAGRRIRESPAPTVRLGEVLKYALSHLTAESTLTSH